jgi:hypothetical protein
VFANAIRERAQMNQLGSHAIALGAGMGGLIAARKLADHYQRVTILKRDGLPAEPEPRKGVPDGRHAHGLLARRRKALEEMLPRLTNELVEAGAIVVDTLADTINYGVYLAKGRSGPQSILSSRPILESAIIDIPWQIAAGRCLGRSGNGYLRTRTERRIESKTAEGRGAWFVLSVPASAMIAVYRRLIATAMPVF